VSWVCYLPRPHQTKGRQLISLRNGIITAVVVVVALVGLLAVGIVSSPGASKRKETAGGSLGSDYSVADEATQETVGGQYQIHEVYVDRPM
jgi:hypothetical protein